MRCNKCPGRLESNCTFNILSTKEKKEQTKQNKTKQNKATTMKTTIRTSDYMIIMIIIKIRTIMTIIIKMTLKEGTQHAEVACSGALFLVVTLFLVLVCPDLILLLKFC